ncbi:riboflavin synthase alpha chain [Alkalibacterium putridalgicola]|uniref:Riboflavin synthase n=1 Tax=Alkalibacterium putridalgicola TaxID=426703 RepID=A0A1H7VYY6_9LACT|nr:riboflavin synthase [Alkalibacterium putridalgicola]GEK89367.1 riboflavin synthase subunit alpha [Alkalibacterium putridalgicola]SEM14005.1 riboflavin synthase alpha chain [Alkalibacterium putridalgicola]
MFTGIVEEIGELKRVKKGAKSSELTIKADKVLEDTKIGDSIMTSGICLTVTSMTDTEFTVDVMSETLDRTSLGDMSSGSKINLERALNLQTRLGGHMVSGHIDGTGIITDFKKDDNAVWITVKAGPELLRYIIEKGSIAIDGISLTVAAVSDNDFKVSIIPHTAEETTLLKHAVGDKVNLEVDLIGKYVEKLLGLSSQKEVQKSALTEAFLKNNGF